MFAAKSIKQNFTPNSEQLQMMDTFKDMVNHCIRIGLENNCSTMKKLSMLSYHQLENYPILSYYKLTAISQAAGRLAQMKKDIKRGRKVTSPFVRKPYLVSCYGFKINGMLLSFLISGRNYANILLNRHTEKILSNKTLEPRSFTITPTALSISVRKEVQEIKPESVIGIDRNLRNITISTPTQPIMYRTNKILSIKENSQFVRASFRRNDRRVKNRFYTKIRGRQTRRASQYLHKISKGIIQNAKESKSAMVFEDLRGIRKLYKKGNGQGNKYRRKLNSWSFYEFQRQVEYKAAWEGIPVCYIDPKRTSKLCPVCGRSLQEDRQNCRKLWCSNCGRLMDRDVVASMNIAYKGWPRFTHPGGLSAEAMKGNVSPITQGTLIPSRWKQVGCRTPDKLTEPA
ncbi:MAG: transposase [Candidatus Nitrosotenuis sp.]